MVVEGRGIHTRSYIGSPVKWTDWTKTYYGAFSYVKKFTKSGKFTTNGCFNVPYTIDSGFHYGGIIQIVTNGWIGSAYGYPSGNLNVDIWISSGSTDNGSIDVYILFIKDYVM